MKSTDRRFTIAFYNVENLFDTENDPSTHDDEFTPWSLKRWTRKRLERKLDKLSTSITRIGEGLSALPPVVLGLSEVENQGVIARLLDRPLMQPYGYRSVHFNSPDSRGMDTALIYMESVFELEKVDTVAVRYTDETGKTDHSRDILYVEGLLFGSRISFYVNHWPSRREGVELTSPRRVIAAEALIEHYAKIQPQPEPPGLDTQVYGNEAFTVVMGDLNDRPMDPAPRRITGTGWFQNPFDALAANGRGSVSHRGAWYLFDQILLSNPFFSAHNPHFAFVQAHIFNPSFLGQYRGKFKGHPFRTYAGVKYKGGYSDHFPVYVVLERLHGSLDPKLN